MSTTSFTYFSHFPPELQLEVWRQVVGPPQIHILRPAPADVFHWVQDFACPIYQAIYAGTNKPVEGDPSKRDSPLFACKAANDALKDKLMKVDLSIFGPGRQVGSYTPSQSRDRLYIDHIIGPLRNAVDSFLRAAVFANLFKYYVEHPEQLEENLLMIIRSVTLVMANNQSARARLPLLPSSVAVSLQTHLSIIGTDLQLAAGSLIGYSTATTDQRKDYFRQAAIQDCEILQYHLTRAHRGLMSYIMPGCTRHYLERGAEFRRAETQRAAQTFVIAPDRDLVYLTDPRRVDLFVRLWQSPWCRKIERLALLVCDCAARMEWYTANLRRRIEALWNEPSDFLVGSRLREVLLVARPAVVPADLPEYRGRRSQALAAHRRDEFGFADFEEVRANSYLFSPMDILVAEENFDRFAAALRAVFPPGREEDIEIRRVVDIDCESIGLTNVEGVDAIYKRTQHQRLHEEVSVPYV